MVSSIKSALIYVGHHTKEVGAPLRGPYGMSVDKHLLMFNTINELSCKRWNIQKIFGEDLTHTLSDITPRETLLVIPAGESTCLDTVFSEETIEAIRNCVNRGMRLYATCGSVYWLAKMRIWNDKCVIQPERMNTIRKQGRVNIFQGTAVGPLSPYPGQTYNTAFFHETVKLECGEKTVTLLLSGGGSFFQDLEGSTDQKMVTLATYSEDILALHGKNTDWKRAIVSCDFGEGKAILSMVHPAYGSEDIDVEAYRTAFPDRADDWAGIRDSLSSFTDRMSFVADILEEFEK